MKVSKKEGKVERQILIAMITNDHVAGSIAAIWKDEGLFRSKWANIVGSWSTKYYRKYEKAIAKDIENVYSSWSKATQANESNKSLDRFLSSISDEYEELGKEVNPEYIIDTAGDYFNEVRLGNLAEEVDGLISDGQAKKARKLVAEFDQVEMGAGAGVDVLTDMESIRKAFDSKSEPLVRYPKPMNKFFRDSLERDAFISFMGPEKRGKSFWLLDLAWRAMLQHKKVAYFQVGDLSKDQIMRRFMTRAAGRPMGTKDVHFPTNIARDVDDKTASVSTELRQYEKPLDWRKAYKACQKILKSKLKTKTPLLKLSVHPNDSINVDGLKSILTSWATKGWTPDVIVIDYADILMPPFGIQESRDQINKTWKQLRGMSQQYHCLLVTATQSDASSYDAETIGRKNFSEDKRKFAHVTGMIGLNATKEEKDIDVMRLNWLVLREDEYSEGRCIHIAGAKVLANPAIKACF